jgi:hypothetical protein
MWLELPIVLVFYEAYRVARIGVHPSASVAYRHAVHVVHFERDTWTFWERTMQQPFLHHRALLTAMEAYYGVAHFAVPAIALILLYVRHPGKYRHWRNVFAWLLVLALVGFIVYPLMPPRLLPGRFGFVDTASLAHALGPVHPGSGGAGGDNPFAAMPSLHVGWSTWSALALASLTSRWWLRIALFAYPALTTVVVCVTANHYLADAWGGLLALGLAYAIEGTPRWIRRWRAGVRSTTTVPAPGPAG